VLCLWWLYINDGRLVIDDFNLKRTEPFFYLLIIKEIYVGNLFPAINSVYFIIIYIVLVHIWDGEDAQNVHCYYLERHCKHDYWPVNDSIFGGTYKPNNLSLQPIYQCQWHIPSFSCYTKSGGCESCCAMLSQWLWIMLCYAEPCGCESRCVMLSQWL
jgi:hypothetical protein